MGLFNHHNNNANTTADPAVPNDPTYNAGAGSTQGNFRRDVEGGAGGALAAHEYEKHHGGGPGLATGGAAGGFAAHEYNKHHHQNAANVDPAANTGAGYGAATTGQSYDPAFSNQNNLGTGPTAAATTYGGTSNDPNLNMGTSDPYASGVGAGVAGAGMGAGGGGMAGAGGLGAGGMGTSSGMAPTGRAPGMSSNQPASDLPSLADARKLERSGKMEKTVGTVLCSTTLKEKGLAKEQEAWQIRGQAESIAQAEALESQARAHRGAAVGLGAGQQHLNPSTAQPTSGNTY